MKFQTLNEVTNILKKLSPKNQEYFITLARVAGIAEGNARKQLISNDKKGAIKDE